MNHANYSETAFSAIANRRYAKQSRNTILRKGAEWTVRAAMNSLKSGSACWKH